MKTLSTRYFQRAFFLYLYFVVRFCYCMQNKCVFALHTHYTSFRSFGQSRGNIFLCCCYCLNPLISINDLANSNFVAPFYFSFGEQEMSVLIKFRRHKLSLPPVDSIVQIFSTVDFRFVISRYWKYIYICMHTKSRTDGWTYGWQRPESQT